MLKALIDPFTNPDSIQFSPFGFGLVIVCFTYPGLLILGAQPGIDLHPLAWCVGILLIVFGGWMERATRRLLWIRVYQSLTTILLLIVFATLLWILLAGGRSFQTQLLTAVMLLLLLGGMMIAIHHMTIGRVDLASMPHGPKGMLHKKTAIVDPTHSPRQFEEHKVLEKGKLNQIGRLSPLLAGISMFLVQILSESGITFMLSVAAIIGISLGLGSIVGLGSYVLSIRQWERDNGKLIYVKK